MAEVARQRLMVKRQRPAEVGGLAEHALLVAETPHGSRTRRQLLRAVCLECDPREFMRLRSQYRR